MQFRDLSGVWMRTLFRELTWAGLTILLRLPKTKEVSTTELFQESLIFHGSMETSPPSITDRHTKHEEIIR